MSMKIILDWCRTTLDTNRVKDLQYCIETILKIREKNHAIYMAKSNLEDIETRLRMQFENDRKMKLTKE